MPETPAGAPSAPSASATAALGAPSALGLRAFGAPIVRATRARRASATAAAPRSTRVVRYRPRALLDRSMQGTRNGSPMTATMCVNLAPWSVLLAPIWRGNPASIGDAQSLRFLGALLRRTRAKCYNQ